MAIQNNENQLKILKKTNKNNNEKNIKIMKRIVKRMYS
jgi:hypothetical protein